MGININLSDKNTKEIALKQEETRQMELKNKKERADKRTHIVEKIIENIFSIVKIFITSDGKKD